MPFSSKVLQHKPSRIELRRSCLFALKMQNFWLLFTFAVSAAGSALLTPEIAGVKDYTEMNIVRREDIAACIACGLSFCIPSPACVGDYRPMNQYQLY